jgi:hypothetical protein
VLACSLGSALRRKIWRLILGAGGTAIISRNLHGPFQPAVGVSALKCSVNRLDASYRLTYRRKSHRHHRMITNLHQKQIGSTAEVTAQSDPANAALDLSSSKIQVRDTAHPMIVLLSSLGHDLRDQCVVPGLRCLRQHRLIWGQGRSRGLVRRRVCDDRETAGQCPESRNVQTAPKPGELHPGSEPARRETDGVLARQSQRQAAGYSSGLLPG